jgi:hypothetical protein
MTYDTPNRVRALQAIYGRLRAWAVLPTVKKLLTFSGLFLDLGLTRSEAQSRRLTTPSQGSKPIATTKKRSSLRRRLRGLHSNERF